MGKIFFISGKSSTGKDTIYKRLLEDKSLGFKKITMYTTRPMRAGESDGEEYFLSVTMRQRNMNMMEALSR